MALTLPFNGTAFPWRVTALEKLVAADDGQGLEAFLKKHPEAANWQATFGKHKHSYLHEAALRGKPAVFEALLKAGAKTGGFSQWGDPLLELALGMGRDARQCAPEVRERMAELLLEQGMDIERVNKSGRTALLEACQQGKEDAARFLLGKGANPHVSAPGGMTPLMYALVHHDRPKLVDMVLETKPDVNLQNSDGMTALFYAWTPAQAYALIEAGANPHHKDKRGRSAGAETGYRARMPSNGALVEHALQVDAETGAAAQAQLAEDLLDGAHVPVKTSPMKPLSLTKKT